MRMERVLTTCACAVHTMTDAFPPPGRLRAQSTLRSAVAVARRREVGATGTT
jgi:hypothetical protein